MADLTDGYVFHPFEQVESTNDTAYALGRDGAPQNTVVLAERQTKGKGKADRQWVSEPGNLFVSWIKRPDISLQEAGELVFVTGLAACRMLEREGVSARLKWPNDVLLEGKKLAGILLESRSFSSGKLDFIVTGVGMNLVSAPALAAAMTTRLQAHVEAIFAPEYYARRLIETYEPLYQQWLEEGFGAIRIAWLERAHGLGRPMTVQTRNEEMTGVFQGLGEHGELVFSAKDGKTRTLSSADVFFEA